MHEEVEIYTVQPGEKLETIAERLGMETAVLRDFHNKRCESFGLLWFSSFVGIQKLVIPKNRKNRVILQTERKKFYPGNELSQHFYHPKYTVTETYRENEAEIFTISYEVFLSLKKIEGENILSYSQKNFLKNGTESDDKMSSIALSCMNAIMPIDFRLSIDGKIIGLHNGKELVSRFQPEKENLQEFYTGEIFSGYLDKFEDQLKNEEYVLKRFKNTPILQMLVPGMGIFHHFADFSGKWSFSPTYLPATFRHTAEYKYDDTETAHSTISANLTDNISLQEVLLGRRFPEEAAEPADISLNLFYETHKTHHSLETANAEIVYTHDGEEYGRRTVNIQKS